LTTLYVTALPVNPTTVALTFLLVVVIVAMTARRRVAAATSVTAFLCYNYFFLAPVRTWHVAEPQDWIALFTLLAVSLTASHLSAEVRRRADEAARLREERNEAELARRAAELKSALVASLGHDLRTPLAAVTVAANSLDASWLTPEQRREQAAIVRSELQRLTRLFDHVVDMARIDADAVAAEPEWVQPAEIVEAAARQVETSLASHDLDTRAVDDGLLVWLDPRLTSAALAHVLENAAQYSPAGSTIDVAVAAAAGELRLAVRDRGPGVAPSDIAHVFDRAYRGDAARHQRFGTGMGLAITRGLVAAAGGRVHAANHPGGGALFTIVVPAPSRPAAVLEGENA
jgi:two-component system sensor histidine kinase KdpD